MAKAWLHRSSALKNRRTFSISRCHRDMTRAVLTAFASMAGVLLTVSLAEPAAAAGPLAIQDAKPSATARVNGAEYFDTVRGCPYAASDLQAFGCLQHRLQGASVRTWLAFVSADGTVIRRHLIYHGPATAYRRAFVHRSGLRAANSVLRRQSFAELKLSPKTVIESGAELHLRWEQSDRRSVGNITPFVVGKAALGAWSRCFLGLRLERTYRTPQTSGPHRLGAATVSSARKGNDSAEWVAIAALRATGLKKVCADMLADSEDLPNLYMVAKFKGGRSQPQVVSTALRPPLSPMCRRLLRCSNALVGRPLATRSRSGRIGTPRACQAALTQLKAQLPKNTAVPDVCVAP